MSIVGEEPLAQDEYRALKLRQRRLAFLQIQEDYIKDEVKNLKRELLRSQEEVRLKLSSR